MWGKGCDQSHWHSLTAPPPRGSQHRSGCTHVAHVRAPLSVHYRRARCGHVCLATDIVPSISLEASAGRSVLITVRGGGGHHRSRPVKSHTRSAAGWRHRNAMAPSHRPLPVGVNIQALTLQLQLKTLTVTRMCGNCRRLPRNGIKSCGLKCGH